jgi:hypothetical protein
MNQYEKLIELIINEQEEKASELFHQIVVEKSREIYENIIDETDFEEAVHDENNVEDLVSDIEIDKEGLPEAEDEDEGDDTEMGMDDEGDDTEMDMDDMGDEEGMDDMGGDEAGEGGLEDRVMDLEAALDDLKAEFDALMADEGGDEAGDMGMGDQEKPMMQEEEDEEELVREYVEKVGNDWDKNGNQGEGKAVGAKSDSVTGATNTNSIVAGKNDMGGSAANIVKGGAESAPDGQRPTGKAGGFLKPAQEIDVAKRNVNKPGGNKGAQNYFSKKETSYEKSHGAEGQTTGGKVPVNPKALQGGKIR